MIGFLRYQLLNYVRSFKFIPPVTLFIGWTIILYTYSGVPILSSYAVTSLVLYVVIVWFTISIFSNEDDVEKQLLFVQLHNKHSYVWGKWIIIFLVVLLFTASAIGYPIIIDSFKQSVEPIHISLALYSHFSLAIFGILVGSFFSLTKVASKKYTWLFAMLIIVVTISFEGIVAKFPFLQWLLLPLPPVTAVLNFMENDSVTIHLNFWLTFAWSIGYSFIGLWVVLKLFLIKER